MNNVAAGEVVRIKPEWQDEGDDLLVWMAIENATKADVRVRIVPINTGMKFAPVHVVKLEWLED